MFKFLKAILSEPRYYYELSWDNDYYKENRIFFNTKEEAEAYKAYWDYVDKKDWYTNQGTLSIQEVTYTPINPLISNKIYLFSILYNPLTNNLGDEDDIEVQNFSDYDLPFESVGKVYILNNLGKFAWTYHYSPEQAFKSFQGHFKHE